MLSNLYVIKRKARAKVCEITQQCKSETKNLENIINISLESCYRFRILLGLSNVFWKCLMKYYVFLVDNAGKAGNSAF